MKRMTVSLLIMALLIAASGCSTKENNSAPQTGQDGVESGELLPEAGAKLIIWDGKDGVPFLKEIAKEFTAKYNIPVEVQEQGAPEQMQKMKTDGPAGLAADVLVLPHDNLSQAVAGGFVLPNDFFEEETKAEFQETAVRAVTLNNVLYGYPRNMETYALFYNKDLVKESDITSWDDIIAFSKSYNDVSKKQYGFMMSLRDLYYAYPFISGYKGYFFGDNNTNPEKIGVNTPQVAEGMKYFQSMREILPVAAADLTTDVKTALFQEGKLAINLDGVWNIGNFSNLSFKVGMMPLPKFPNGEAPRTFAGVKAYYVSAFSKYPNAAKLFARFVTTKEALVKNFEVSGFIPARNDMENEPVIVSNEMVSGAIRQFAHSDAIPTINEMRAVWEPMANALELIWNGEAPQATLDKAAANIKQSIETLNK